MKILLLLLALATTQGSPTIFLSLTCPICEPEFCPNGPEDCPLGVIPDGCGCCSAGICQLSVGDRCLNTAHTPAMSLTDLRVYAGCGDSMQCRMRTDLDPLRKSQESTCTCLDSTPVCGTDNRTYNNPCAVKTAPGSPQISHTGPCAVAPQITVPPVSSTSAIGESVALGCEVYGVPVPVIVWQFEEIDGTLKTLPGDDVSMVVQSRGGPDSLMVTSWMQIVSARVADSGKYICIASNENGETRAEAHVIIRTLY